MLAASPAEVALPSLVLYELTYGASRAQAPARVRRGLESLLKAVRVLPFGEAEARTAARVAG